MQNRSGGSSQGQQLRLARELLHAMDSLSQSQAQALLPVAENLVLRAPAGQGAHSRRLSDIASKVVGGAGVGAADPASTRAQMPFQRAAFMAAKLCTFRRRALTLTQTSKSFLQRLPTRGEAMRWTLIGLQLTLWLVASSVYYRVTPRSRVPFVSSVVVVSRADTENGGALPINTALALGRSVHWIPSGLHRATPRQLWASFDVRVRPVLRVHMALAKGRRNGTRAANNRLLTIVVNAQRSILSAPPKPIRRAALIVTEGEWLIEFSACAPLWIENGAKMVLFQRVAWNEDTYIASSVCRSAVALDDYNSRILQHREPAHATIHVMRTPILSLNNLRVRPRCVQLIPMRRTGLRADSPQRILLVALQPVEPYMNKMLEYILQFVNQLERLDWAVRVRPHPSQHDFDTRGLKRSRASLASDLFESDALITGVSNTSFSARKFGVPVFSFCGDEFEPASFVRSLPIDAFVNEESDLASILSALPRKPGVRDRTQARELRSELLQEWQCVLEMVRAG